MFKKATKTQTKLRAALFGPSGAGKTFTALRIATGIGGAIAVIDTERGSASKYADRFAFDVLELGRATIDEYITGIQAAGQAGYQVLVIDSMSHGWQELLTEIDRLAATKYRGNTWSAWSEGTPKQRRLVDAILGFPGHLIATMRSKTEWTTQTNNNGRQTPVRVGLAPEQGKGIEYEFDLLLELTQDHIGTVLKDRTGKFQDRLLEKPGEDFGRDLAQWLLEGAEPPSRPLLAAVPDGEPHFDTALPTDAVDPKIAAFIGKVIARARQLGNFAEAEALLRDRLDDNQAAVDYAMDQLALASDQARWSSPGQTAGEPAQQAA